VRGHLNDGKTKYEGLSEPLTNAFGSCPFSFRTSSHPIVVKVTNSKSSFKVTLNGNVCFETNQVMLQPDSYFGISASTADVPDQHEVFDFKVTPLRADLSFLEKTVEQSIKEGNIRDGIQVVQDPAQASAGAPTYVSSCSSPRLSFEFLTIACRTRLNRNSKRCRNKFKKCKSHTTSSFAV
jgi:Legume-like lectin family